MLISCRWLARHVDLDGITPEQLALDLSVSVAEVEDVRPFAPHLADVKVGYVQTREQHPNADKLSVCTVDVGGPELLQIVCGAPNVAAGQKVAVGEVGTVLPGGIKLKKAKIRGVESRGMICSVKELDLGDDHDGIWVLPEDAPVGQPVNEALGLVDHVIEFDNKSLTHRPDLWGHRGIAAEIAALYRRELKPLDLTLPKTGEGTPYPVRIESEACPRYIALPVDGVENRQSPDWLKFLLLAVEQRPLDLLVDVSNFVMLDLGQPNHLFDRTRLSPEGIVVRMAREGEIMTTLDGVERKLGTEDLLICSGDEPVALAGVMGGEGSKVAEGTNELLLEIANFHPTTIRRTAARLACRTDSSARFEKSLDPNLPLLAAAHLVRTLKGIQPELSLPAPPTDVGAWKDPSSTIELRAARVRTMLGIEILDEEIADALTRLGFGVEAHVETHAATFSVRVPSSRASKDVTIEEDLVEEIARLHGLDRIGEAPLVGEAVPPPHDERRVLVRKIQDRLAGGARFHEVLTYSFLSESLATQLGVADEPYVQVVNPVAEGESRVRRGLVPSLLGLVERNRRNRSDVRLFEVGKGYLPEHANERGEPREVHEAALVWAAPAPGKKARYDAGRLLQLRAVVDDLVSAVGRGRLSWRQFDEDGGEEGGERLPPWLHAGRALVACLADGSGGTRVVGLLGELEPGLHKQLGLTDELTSDVAVARLSLDELVAIDANVGAGYRPLPKFPGIKVDVALSAPDGLPAGDLIAAIERSGKGLVASCELFDLYRGTSVGEGKKSLAFHVLLQSDKKTLSDKEGQKFLDRLERAATELGAELRRQ